MNKTPFQLLFCTFLSYMHAPLYGDIFALNRSKKSQSIPKYFQNPKEMTAEKFTCHATRCTMLPRFPFCTVLYRPYISNFYTDKTQGREIDIEAETEMFC